MQQKQIPLGPRNETCSRLGGRPCSEVCYDHETERKCTLWNEFRGRDATGEEFNGWFCGEAMKLRMLMEVAKEVRQGAAATESFRNEMVQIGVAQLARQDRTLHMREIDGTHVAKALEDLS